MSANMKRREFITLLGGAAAWPLAARAEDYPTRSVKLITQGAAASGPDVIARIVAEHLGRLWGQQVVILNQLAREIVRGARWIGLLDDINDPKSHPQRVEIEAAGQALELQIVTVEVRRATDIAAAYDRLATEGVEAVIVAQSNMLVVSRKETADAAAKNKLPTVYGYREHVQAGGLISYGINLDWCFHRAASYVDKILKGAKPAELPIEFPTKIEMSINLKTAKALGLEIPPTLLVRADEIIE